MPYNWIDASQYSMNTLLLFDRWVLEYLLSTRAEDGQESEQYLALAGRALAAHPQVRWYCRIKAPATRGFIERAMSLVPPTLSAAEARQAEIAFLQRHETFVVYAYPEAMNQVNYIRDWDPKWLDELIDLSGMVVLDVGAGTGRLSLAAAHKALRVYASEPCDVLRDFLRDEVRRRGLTNVRVLDGLVTSLPFEDATLDAVLSGHVVGDDYDAEIAEMRRITKPGGWLVICNGDDDFRRTGPDAELLARGFESFVHTSPSGGIIYNYRLRVQPG
ncbi:MAG: class I SAM-dependent methyltransferase [Anaerolineae bacterium]|nr:class I SAM-dependent methyltransferase [Chloroflexota bacterium]